MIVFDFCNYYSYPKNRFIHIDEQMAVENFLQLSEKSVEKLSISNAKELLAPIALVCSDEMIGSNQNIIDCQIQGESTNLYRTCYAGFGKNCGYCFWPRTSQNIFGSSLLFDCDFCLKGYNSNKLTRCFEVDSSSNCVDSHYLHNCENVKNGIMCFNARNMSYAVGNTVVGPEKFKRTRAMLLEWINQELERNRTVPLSIFNIGQGMKRRI